MAKKEYEKEEELYIEQMKNWFEEQEIIEIQIVRLVESYYNIVESNKKQLALHRERVNMGRLDFENWKIDNKID